MSPSSGSASRLVQWWGVWCLIVGMVFGCLPERVFGQGDPAAGPQIEEIRVRFVGPATVSEDLIRSNIRSRVGEPFSQKAADDDVTTLFSTGYFYNIRVSQQRADGGRVILVYLVQSKPILTEIRYTGNKRFSLSRLRRKTTSKVGQPLDERKLFADAQEIRKAYEKAGMQNTTVTPMPSINEQLGRGTVTFEIKEAPKVRIESVDFEGNKAFASKKLRKVIKTRRRNWLGWLTGAGKFKEDQFEEDKEKLRTFYAENGYVDFEIQQIELEHPRTNRMEIEFTVSEGTQFRVGAVTFEGNKKFTQAEIVSNMRDSTGVMTRPRLAPGAIFRPGDLEKDLEGYENFYGAQGHIDAKVTAQKIPNVDTQTIDLKYMIQESDRSFIKKIEIRGNTKTKDKVIRRELAVSPGETFDMVRVKVSKSRLEQMNYFEKVDAKDAFTDAPGERNLVVTVEEKNTGNVAFGAGFSSVDQLVGYVEVTQGNFDLFNPPTFTGGGQKARARAQVGTARQDYILGFTEPWFLGRRLRLDTELYYRNLAFLSDYYTQTVLGGSVGLTKALPYNFSLNTTYTLQDVNIVLNNRYMNALTSAGQQVQYVTNGGQVSIVGTNTIAGQAPIFLQQAGKTLVSSLNWTLSHDTRNNLMLPTKGHLVQFEPMLAGGPLGGQASFYQLEMKAAQYWSPANFFSPASDIYETLKEHILEVVGNVGVVNAYGSGDRGREGVTPIFNRYYLGGMYSLRGFRFREVGPKQDLTAEPYGGGTFWYGSTEYSVPVIPRVRFAAFFDIGMVYPDAYSFEPERYLNRTTTGLYNSNWGVGLRLNLPIGPLRLDYGIPIVSDQYNRSSGQFQFGVGYTRDF